MAASPVSPVRMRMIWSIAVTKIFPSPIFPVCDAVVIASITASACSGPRGHRPVLVDTTVKKLAMEQKIRQRQTRGSNTADQDRVLLTELVRSSAKKRGNTTPKPGVLL